MYRWPCLFVLLYEMRIDDCTKWYTFGNTEADGSCPREGDVFFFSFCVGHSHYIYTGRLEAPSGSDFYLDLHRVFPWESVGTL